MDCEQARHLMDAYVDGELDLMRSLEIEQHLEGCASCATLYKNDRMLQSVLTGGSFYYKAPPALTKNIQRSLRQQGKRPLVISQRWLALAASLLVVLMVGVVLRTIASTPSPNNLTDEIVSSHIRSLVANHLEDVISTDQHTVKPWFDGKLDFSPPVVDLAAQGFPLIGGRLDYINNRTVAALVYQRRKHIINLFIWPSASGDTPLATSSEQGYQVSTWTQGGMTFWAVSDVASSDLELFAQSIQAQIAQPATPES